MLVNDNADSRRMIESCYKRHKTTVNPIIEWTDVDVWQFIRANGISYCELYDCGFKRLGCVMCPMASRKERERERYLWPKIEMAYLAAFERMLKERKLKERKLKERPTAWQTPEEVMQWWLESDVLPGQYNLFEMEEQ